MNKLKTLFISLLATIGFVMPVFALGTVGAQAEDQLCRGVLLGDSTTDCDDIGEDAENDVVRIANTVIDVISLIVGIVSVVMIIVGGFKYVVGGGSGDVSGAKNTILYAIIGLVIVIFAQTIVKFVVNRLLGN